MSILLKRHLHEQVLEDLKTKMVFLGGPRQVGKTTFAQNLIPNFYEGHPGYLNWDDLESREKILLKQWPSKQRLIVLDEIHKFRNWRGLLKGFYDMNRRTHQFLVTGSARLDHYRKGGDSLLGRYYYYRLHPLSWTELGAGADLKHLLKFGGFPEPHLRGSDVELKRWHRQRADRVIYSDIRDLERVKEITLIELLISALPDRVGAPLSRKSLGEDLQVDQKTVERWLQILENVYYCYRLPPFGSPRIRAVKKEAKLYLWDWSEIESEGFRWENMVASHLLKFCHYREDVLGEKMELRYLRDTDKREIDFVVVQNKKPLFAVECKTGERNLSPHIQYFAERTRIPMFYQVHLGTKERQISDRVRILPFATFAAEVGLV